MRAKWIITCCAFISSCILWSSLILAADVADGLYLCGIVTETNIDEAFIKVDVQSESCRGPQKFKLSMATGRATMIVGERKCFFIDSSRCDEGYLYTITKIDSE